MQLPSNYWDDLAKKYPRYNDASIQRDAAFIFEKARAFGLNLEGKTVLDIGCGTGTLALQIAHQTAHIDALDASSTMLEVFKQDIATLNMESKIKLFHSSWDDFVLRHVYDIALASMTPAIGTDITRHKFIDSAFAGIFVGWGAYKHNDVLDCLFGLLGINQAQAFGQTQDFANFLQSKQIRFSVDYFETSWCDIRTKEDAIRYCQNHLARFDKKVDDQFLDDFLLKHTQDDKIPMITTAQKGVVIFSK